MKFLEPGVLWNLLWVLPLMILIFASARHRRKKAVSSLAGSGAVENLSCFKRGMRFVLLLLTVLLLFTALARPSWDYEIHEMKGSGRDILVLFDVSKSMLCKDVQPSRLEHARWLVRELVKRNPGDRFGLIAFAGKAFMECPLTVDQGSFLQTVSDLDVNSIPVGGTNIEAAFQEALAAFEAAESPNRAILLITDGDELEGSSSTAVKEVAARKIPVFVAGIGDPSQPAIVQVPDGNGGVRTLKDENGNVVNSHLNEKQMEALAAETRGIYVRSTSLQPEIASLERRIRSLDSKEFDTFKSVKPIERFQWPLAFAMFFFLLWLLTGERRRVPRALLLFFLAVPFVNAQSPVPAVKQDAKQTAKVPEKVKTPEEQYNEYRELQLKGELKKAEEGYTGIISSAGITPELRGRAFANMAVIAQLNGRKQVEEAKKTLQTQKLEEALKQVTGAIGIQNESEKYNREAMRLVRNAAAVGENQSALLADRKKAEELKKKIEDLIKKQQEARKKTQQARDQQKQQNQQKQDQQKQDQQKQDQQKQDQQKQDQQKQDQQKQDQQKNDLQSQTQQARNSVKEMENQAKELGQKKMEEQAEKAGSEIEKAQQAQQKGSGKEAKEHLDKALQALGNNQPPQNKQNQKKDSSGKDQKKDDKKDSSGKDQKQPQNQPRPQQAQARPAEQKKGDFSKEEAAAILDAVAKDEKDLRKELKREKSIGVPPVRKDW